MSTGSIEVSGVPPSFFKFMKQKGIKPTWKDKENQLACIAPKHTIKVFNPDSVQIEMPFKRSELKKMKPKDKYQGLVLEVESEDILAWKAPSNLGKKQKKVIKVSTNDLKVRAMVVFQRRGR